MDNGRCQSKTLVLKTKSSIRRIKIIIEVYKIDSLEHKEIVIH